MAIGHNPGVEPMLRAMRYGIEEFISKQGTFTTCEHHYLL